MTLKSVRNVLRKSKILLNPMFGSDPFTIPYMCVASRIIVSPEHEFVYIRIPKAANSTVSAQLWSCVNNEYLDTSKRVKEVKKNFLSAKQVSLKQSKEAVERFTFFTFVRNPYDRVLSAYLDKFSINKYIKKYGDQIVNSEGGELNFKSFCKYLRDKGLYADPHWMPQYEFIWPSIKRINEIGRVENLNTDLYNIFFDLFNDCKIELSKSYGPKATNSAKKREVYYDRECKDIVNELYVNDFRAFNYQIE